MHSATLAMAKQLVTKPTRDGFEEFLTTLDHLSAETRRHVLNHVDLADAQLRRLFADLLANEQPTLACEATFARAFSRALAWQECRWAAFAAWACALWLQRRRGDTPRALAFLDEAVAELGFDPVLADARATIRCEAGDLAGGLAIWSELLPEWHADLHGDLAPVHSLWRAGCVAAELQRFGPAQSLWLDAADRLTAEVAGGWRTGLLCDAGHAAWLAGDRALAVTLLHQALVEADAVGNPWRQAQVGATLATINVQAASQAPSSPALSGAVSDPDAQADDAESMPAELMWLHLLRLDARSGLYALLAAHGDALEASPRPLVRWHVRLMRLRSALEEHRWSAVLLAAVTASRALRACIGQDDPGTFSAGDVQGGHGPADLAVAIAPLLLAGLVLAAAQGERIVLLLDSWLAETAVMAAEPTLAAWLQEVRSMTDWSLNGAWTCLLAPDRGPDARLLAAALIMAETGAMPNQVFFAHAWLAMWAADDTNRVGRDLLQETVASLVADSWLMQCRRRFLLRTPDVAIPAIQAACEGSAGGWPKVVAILQAAQIAVDVRTSDELAAAMRRLLQTA